MEKFMDKSTSTNRSWGLCIQGPTESPAQQLTILLRKLIAQKFRGEMDDDKIEMYVKELSDRTLADIETLAIVQENRTPSILGAD